MFDGDSGFLEKAGLFFLGLFLILCGLGMIEMSFTEFEEWASIIGCVVFGLLFVVGGGALIWLEYAPSAADIKSFLGLNVLEGVKSEVSPGFAVLKDDKNADESLLRAFRADLAAFFAKRDIADNSEIQNDVTQLYWHILALQKKRLDSKGITLEMTSERMWYKDIASVRQHAFSDGKYKIADVSETIEAKRVFKKRDGRVLTVVKSLETAWYRLLEAQRQGKDDIVCPCCGTYASRENLIDGCDSCGTKFTVEDLDKRISDFAFRPDYEVEYAKYTAARATYGRRAGLLIGVPVFLLSLIGSASVSGSFGAGPVMKAAAVLFSAAFCTFAAVYFGLLGFYFLIFPLIQAKASLVFMGKQHLQAMKQRGGRDEQNEKEVRRHDALFSLNGFYSNVQNKLAVIHFADNGQAAAAFAEGGQAEAQIGALLPQYADVVSMDMDEIHLNGYVVKNGLQRAEVSVELNLLEERQGRAVRRKEILALELIKNAGCTTQAVCAPTFLKCRSCGASLSYLEGKICEHCGSERKLSDIDWAIASYTVK